jgi:hypothetical protein
MLALQAVPPVPPVPSGSEMSVTGTLIWPLIRAMAGRIEGGAMGAQLQTEVDALRDRVRQLEEIAPRMADLEERLDFTERVVAQGREPDRLQR